MSTRLSYSDIVDAGDPVSSLGQRTAIGLAGEVVEEETSLGSPEDNDFRKRFSRYLPSPKHRHRSRREDLSRRE